MLKNFDDGKKFAASYPYPLHAWHLGKEMLVIGMGAEWWLTTPAFQGRVRPQHLGLRLRRRHGRLYPITPRLPARVARLGGGAHTGAAEVPPTTKKQANGTPPRATCPPGSGAISQANEREPWLYEQAAPAKSSGSQGPEGLAGRCGKHVLRLCRRVTSGLGETSLGVLLHGGDAPEGVPPTRRALIATA